MKPDLVIIGGSAGSLQVVLEIISLLNTPVAFSIVCVFHRKYTPHDNTLITLLQSKSLIPVKEAEDKEMFKPGHIYVAPANYHLLLETDRSFSLDISEKINFSRPSIDVAFMTAADALGNKLMGILLSGANSDGVLGLKRIREKGGYCIAQDPATASVSYMPAQAVAQKVIHERCSPKEIAVRLNQYG